MPQLARLYVYPIKSLDGVALERCDILASGALRHDRRFALVDAEDRLLNGKRTPRVHGLRAIYVFDERDQHTLAVRLRRSSDGASEQFQIPRELSRLEAWLGEHFGEPVRVKENAGAGYPDDTESPGPTIVSQGTLTEIASWFPGMDADEVQRRLRVNLILDTTVPFWEDRLFAEAGSAIPFKVGSTEFLGINPCQRCVVPSRSSWEGTVTPQFAKIFAERRQATLPAWASASRFNHFYRATVNTRPPAGFGGGTISLGDEIDVSPPITIAPSE